MKKSTRIKRLEKRVALLDEILGNLIETVNEGNGDLNNRIAVLEEEPDTKAIDPEPPAMARSEEHDRVIRGQGIPVRDNPQA